MMKNMTKKRKTNKNIRMMKRKNTRKIIKLKCSPSINKKEYSCLSDEAIYKFKKIWNNRHPDDLIKTSVIKDIWLQIKEKMENVCNKESCWLKQNFVNGKLNKELENSFAPLAPVEWKKNPNEWLSSIDINKVMKQYEKTYKCFEFIGPSPIDYDTRKLYGECVWEELCHFSLEDKIKEGKFKIGVIFNLDPHYKSGSHWVSLFINIRKKTIFYFDSTGEKIPNQIMKLVNTVVEQGNKLKTPIKFSFDQNYPVEHQYGNTECGVYSLFFITHMLEDKITSHYLKTHILKDKYIEKFRKVFFNDEL